jgi:flavin-dependent dehydrogenase
MHEPPAAAPRAVDLLVVGLGPGGCAAALAAHQHGLHTLAIEARGIEATRSRLILVRPAARAALRRLGLPDVTEGRRTTTIQQVETRMREAVVAAASASASATHPGAPLELRWHTRLVAVEARAEQVHATMLDEATGVVQHIVARHVVDASGGRLEPLGRPARVRRGPSHRIVTAQYAAPPWFEGIVGVRDRERGELYLLFPTWGRHGVIAYHDAPPDRCTDPDALLARFEAVARGLGLGEPMQPVTAVDVFQRALERPSRDRVLPIGDAVGTVDVLWGAGLSSSIEDGIDAIEGIVAARAEATPRRAASKLRTASARIFARHRRIVRQGLLMLALRPLLARAWPTGRLPDIDRGVPGPPPLLWPAVRLVFGRRPQAS